MKPATLPPRKNPSVPLLVLAVASSILASTCCLMPLALVLVGITGAWMTHLTAMRPVTPLFTVIALGALAWAGVLIFRPATACSTAEGAACDRTRRVTRWTFLGCAAFIALLLLVPLIAPYFY